MFTCARVSDWRVPVDARARRTLTRRTRPAGRRRRTSKRFQARLAGGLDSRLAACGAVAPNLLHGPMCCVLHTHAPRRASAPCWCLFADAFCQALAGVP